MNRFIRTFGLRIAVGVVLAIAVYGALTAWLPWQREQLALRKIEAFGRRVIVHSKYCGPTWIPQMVREFVPFFDRVGGIRVLDQDGRVETPDFVADLTLLRGLDQLELWRLQISDDDMAELAGLTNVYHVNFTNSVFTDGAMRHLNGIPRILSLVLCGTPLTDSGLAQLKNKVSLQFINLEHTRITDLGLEHLKELPKLQHLMLRGTRTTIEGRDQLRKALPDCMIVPSP